ENWRSAGEARVWDASTGQLLFVLGSTNYVHAAEFSPDGAAVLTATADGKATIWEAKTGQRRRLFEHTNEVLAATFSPDGWRLVTAAKGGQVRLWDLSAGTLLHQWFHR